jgi:hypothetical protein
MHLAVMELRKWMRKYRIPMDSLSLVIRADGNTVRLIEAALHREYDDAVDGTIPTRGTDRYIIADTPVRVAEFDIHQARKKASRT